MKKQLIGIVGLLLTLSIAMTGCSDSSGSFNGDSSAGNNRVPSSQASGQSRDEDDNTPSSNTTELTVQFGDRGDSFVMHLEDNSTAAAIAGYVGTTDWRLPVYSYDESDVMEYYDIPSRYEIPDNSETVTEAHAGDVFYSDPNRIVLYYADRKNPHSRQGADRYRLSRQAERLGHAGESLSVVRKICRWDIGATGVHGLYRELQDLYQVPKIQKADGKPG